MFTSLVVTNPSRHWRMYGAWLYARH